jgi:hypothetical protein
MAELLIRAAMNDHLVVSDLLASDPGPRLATRRRPPISQLVADAHVAEARPVLADLAQGAGVPYLVDPDTPFLQSGVAEDDRWAQLPFAQADPVAVGDVDTARLVAEVVDFQLDKGATTIIPPYFYASSPMDPWFMASLNLVDRTAEHLHRNGIRLPVLPVLCAQLQSFGNTLTWSSGLDRFVERVKGIEASSVGLCFSPAGAGQDGYGKVRRLFDTARRAKALGLRVIAWRQGIYGPGLVAAGLDGYECGIGTGEQTNVARQQSTRKPRRDGSSGGGGGGGIFIETLGRSVPRRVGQILLGETAMRPKVMCDDEGCCPSVAATLDKPRHHAVRTRARLLGDLADQPAAHWRLNHIAREAAAAMTVATQANRVLADQRAKERIKTRNLEALSQVAGELSEGEAGSRIA